MNTEPVYRLIAEKLIAIDNYVKASNWEWKEKHEEALDALMRDTAPSGGGIDNGVELLVSESSREKLVFSCAFHHMNENGYYDGWTEHKAIVTPSLFSEISIRFTGRNRNEIKDYLHDVLSCWLTEKVERD